MTDDLVADLTSLSPDLIAWRRDFHRHPELAFNEQRTSGVIRGFLEGLGIEVQSFAGTGLRGMLRGAKSGPTVALRADMDALPVAEDNDTEYKSENVGTMHACGHDGHMAIVMGVAKLLASRRDSLSGNVAFLFQPSEEDPPGGAKRMIEEGALRGVDRVFGLHLWQPLPTGVVGIRVGPFMAQSDNFRLTIHGRGGHASQPQNTIDPVVIASHVVVAAQSIVSRHTDPLAPAVVSFSTIHGGRTYNIIPDDVVLTGTVRTFEAAVQKSVSGRLRKICEGTCGLFGASAEFEYMEGYPPVVNDASMVDLVTRVARDELGDGTVRTIDPVMGGEDFAYYLREVPGSFMMLGIGDGRPYPHHNSRFDIDERALPIGVRLLASIALEAMK